MVELFGSPRPGLGVWYTLRACAAERGSLRAAGGLAITAPYTLRAIDTAGTIIVPGWRRPYTEVPAELIRKLRRAHADGARVLSVCSGVFVLAAAGLLDGLRATTHWAYADELREAYPDLALEPDALYVDEGRVLTSAGSAAGLDLGLHLIRRDHGAAIANAVAKRLVIPPHREGGQRQFIEAPMTESAGDNAIAALLDDVRSRLASPHTVESLARRARMSPRTFARRFAAVTGTTPHRWLVQERVQRAQSLLETSDADLESIATIVGFGDAQLLRLHFRRVVGVSPSAYRKTFRRTNAGT